MAIGTVQTPPAIPHYVPAAPTKVELDYADLAIIDLSKAQGAEGLRELAIQARNAMREQGFFYVINHGYTQPQTERIFDIADVPFSLVDDNEKRQYVGKMLQGSFLGYKLRQYWHVDGGVQDQVENFNLHHRNLLTTPQPAALRPLLPELAAFARHNHSNVLHAILRLLALGLELPEDAFVKTHGFDTNNESYVRFMKYHPRTEDEEAKSNHTWLKGHTDFGSITILWSQPVAALQILSPDGQWRWIKHIDNALVVNAGDALEFLSGGYYKATIHRVVQPPVDQRGYTRLGAFYFAMPDEDVLLSPVTESPVLQKTGIHRRFDDGDAPNMGTWRRGRTVAYGKTQLHQGQEKGVEEEYINGILVKHYK